MEQLLLPTNEKIEFKTILFHLPQCLQKSNSVNYDGKDDEEKIEPLTTLYIVFRLGCQQKED